MKVAIRVDASYQIASGHVVRCLTLAQALARAGATVSFISREHPGNLNEWIHAHGFICHPLSAPAPPHTVNKKNGWLGVDIAQDCKETANILETLGNIDWLVVDHYTLDNRWQIPLRPVVGHILVIDDLANRVHDCDLLIDQNLFPNFETRYQSRVPVTCTCLLGPKYAFLRQEFIQSRQRIINQEISDASYLLVFFGGVDATNETGKFLSAWQCISPNKFPAHVIVGSQNPQRTELIHLANQLNGVHIYGQIENMAKMMTGATYMFGASGTTNWERFCLGLNTSITSVAENQIKLAEYLNEVDLVDYLGSWRTTDQHRYANALIGLNLDLPLYKIRRKKMMALVDGYGADRVTAYMARLSC